jgi:hypothetical protein
MQLAVLREVARCMPDCDSWITGGEIGVAMVHLEAGQDAPEFACRAARYQAGIASDRADYARANRDRLGEARAMTAHWAGLATAAAGRDASRAEQAVTWAMRARILAAVTR